MAKSNILTADGKVACPHCRVPIGKLSVEGILDLGFVSIVDAKPHTVNCNDCKKDFTYRPPPREERPFNESKLPPRGASNPL